MKSVLFKPLVPMFADRIKGVVNCGPIFPRLKRGVLLYSDPAPGKLEMGSLLFKPLVPTFQERIKAVIQYGQIPVRPITDVTIQITDKTTGKVILEGPVDLELQKSLRDYFSKAVEVQTYFKAPIFESALNVDFTGATKPPNGSSYKMTPEAAKIINDEIKRQESTCQCGKEKSRAGGKHSVWCPKYEE